MKALRLKEIQERRFDKISLRKLMADLYIEKYSYLSVEECYKRLAYMSDIELMKLIINHYYLFYE